ncbi:MAG: hypothetical protein HY287_11785 [Planctomycetes bacterium]|nr:hypothetical protein [Planctomycetota bacterium]
MASILYRASNESELPRWFQIHVVREGDRWMSTCVEADSQGNEKAGASSLAPAFYGLNEEQAHRKMLAALENTFSEVTEVVGGHE